MPIMKLRERDEEREREREVHREGDGGGYPERYRMVLCGWFRRCISL